MRSKRYIPVLITVALLALIGLQVIWLFMVYKHKEQELKDKTREAVLETTKRLQKEEDAKLIIQNMDSLLITDNIIGSDSKEEIRVIVSNIKDHLKTDTLRIPKGKHHERKIKIINDSNESTTVVNVGNRKTNQVIISSETSYKTDFDKYVKEFHLYVEEYQKHAKEFQRLAIESKEQTSKEKIKELQNQAKEEERIAKEFHALAKEKELLAKEQELLAKDVQTKVQSLHIESKNLEDERKEQALESKIAEKKNIKKKAKELETVFLKMAIGAKNSKEQFDKALNIKRIKEILNDELEKRGIDLIPKISIAQRLDPDTLRKFFDNPAKGWRDTVWNSPDYIISLPLFPGGIFGNDPFIDVYYPPTTAFVIKQMAGLLALSLFITILIGFVMIYIFRRMLSQEKLHQLKNDFINNMAHELKTPIATISLAIDGINNPTIKNDETKFNNYSNILKEENKKLNSHVERVLQMALLEKGELALDKKEVDLKPLIENCINAYQLQIQNKKAKVSFETNTENLFVSGDEFHLLNAFTNLVDNALKYSGENSEITISLNKIGDIAEIIFKDNGIGIDRNLQEKVFEKFYRAQGGNLHDVKGFGLGLSYVRSIIEVHDGTIELKSEKNKGSEFIIKLKANAA